MVIAELVIAFRAFSRILISCDEIPIGHNLSFACILKSGVQEVRATSNSTLSKRSGLLERINRYAPVSLLARLLEISDGMKELKLILQST